MPNLPLVLLLVGGLGVGPAAQGAEVVVGQWVSEERDVAADFRAAFGEEPPPISGVAIAADTDQTGETVRAWLGDIRFFDG